MMPHEYNQELILVHQFLQQQYTKFRQSHKLKTNQERLQYAHALKTVEDIAYNCNITPKNTPHNNK